MSIYDHLKKEGLVEPETVFAVFVAAIAGGLLVGAASLFVW